MGRSWRRMEGDKAELVLSWYLNREVYCSAGFLPVVPILRGLTLQSLALNKNKVLVSSGKPIGVLINEIIFETVPWKQTNILSIDFIYYCYLFCLFIFFYLLWFAESFSKRLASVLLTFRDGTELSVYFFVKGEIHLFQNISEKRNPID